MEMTADAEDGIYTKRIRKNAVLCFAQTVETDACGLCQLSLRQPMYFPQKIEVFAEDLRVTICVFHNVTPHSDIIMISLCFYKSNDQMDKMIT